VIRFARFGICYLEFRFLTLKEQRLLSISVTYINDVESYEKRNVDSSNGGWGLYRSKSRKEKIKCN